MRSQVSDAYIILLLILNLLHYCAAFIIVAALPADMAPRLCGVGLPLNGGTASVDISARCRRYQTLTLLLTLHY